MSHLDIVQVFIIGLDAQPDFGLLHLGPLLKDETIGIEDVPLQEFPLIREDDELPAVLELATQTLEFFGTLDIASPRFPSLSHLSSPEADIRVQVVAFLLDFKLQRRVQGATLGLSLLLPILIDALGVLHHLCCAKLTQARDHVVIGDDGLVDFCIGGVEGRRIFKHLEDLLKDILGEVTSNALLLVVCL